MEGVGGYGVGAESARGGRERGGGGWGLRVGEELKQRGLALLQRLEALSLKVVATRHVHGRAGGVKR